MRTSSLSAKKVLRVALVAAFWLIIWQIAAWLVGMDLLLPGPLTVGRALWDLLGTADFRAATGFSLLGVLIGFLAGVALGTLLAFLTWASDLADALLSPILRIVRTAPVASFIILVLLWFASRTVPMVIAGLMVVPILWSSTKTAMEETDKALLEMARAYRFTRLHTFRHIYLPQIIPQWTAAATTALGFAWKSGIAAEVIARPSPAMGTNLYQARSFLNTPELFAWTALIILLSFILERFFLRLMARLARRYTV
ncbi:MAG: ABC transporter permease subunit [Oscillospiraceae bacterium]|nr:ABC transporter permease subunit [Oscillospiraceae bacterium]